MSSLPASPMDLTRRDHGVSQIEHSPKLVLTTRPQSRHLGAPSASSVRWGFRSPANLPLHYNPSMTISPQKAFLNSATVVQACLTCCSQKKRGLRRSIPQTRAQQSSLNGQVPPIFAAARGHEPLAFCLFRETGYCDGRAGAVPARL